MSQIDEARSRYDIRTIVHAENKRKIVCPLPQHVHHDFSPSFSIFFRSGVQYFTCHGSCGCTGDVVDLIGYLNVPNYNRKDKGCVKQALRSLEIGHDPEVVIPEKDIVIDGNEWQTHMPPGPDVFKYALGRGLTRETVVKFRLGQSSKFMTMPNFEEGQLIGIKMRRMVEGDPRFISIEGSRLGLFNFDAVNLCTSTVFIVKGEIPCMLLDQLGFRACSPTGGEGSSYRSDRWRIALALCNKIVIGDNDEAGVKLGTKRAGLLGAKLVFPKTQYKDIDQWILEDPKAAVEQLNQWLEEMYA